MKKFINVLLVLFVVSTKVIAEDWLVVDTSSSLSSKAQEVEGIVHEYLKTSSNVLAFADKPYFIKHKSELKFEGGTALSLAFEKIKPLGVDFLVLVTDGEPNNKNQAIALAKELQGSGTVICAIYASESLVVPDTFKQIASKTFGVKQLQSALKHCSAVRLELLGTEAVYKSIDENKYVF